MVHAGFPFSMLDERLIASRKTLPSSEDFDRPAEVLSIQANFIQGGLLLCFSAQHICTDIAGQCTIIDLFAKACRGEAFSDEDLQVGNLPRADLIPLPSRQDMSSNEPTVLPPKENHDGQVEQIESGNWYYIAFSSGSLAPLKSHAISTLPTGFEGFISTDDVLSAFLWQRITATRTKRLSSLSLESEKTAFERLVDSRDALGLPAGYTGNCTHKVSTSLNCKDVLEHSLGTLASELRTTLSLETSQEVASSIKRVAATTQQNIEAGRHANIQDVATRKERPKVNPLDIKMSSWAKTACYNFDFGAGLGKPEAVRRPGFEAWEGLAYFMPREVDGSITAAVCLREDDANLLREDEDLEKYGVFLG